MVRSDLIRLIENEELVKDDENFRRHITDLRSYVDAYTEELARLRVRNLQSSIQPWKMALKAWWLKESLEESAQKICQMGAQVTMHIIAVGMPRLNESKFDQLLSQGEEIGTGLSQQMSELQNTVKELGMTQESKTAIVLATEKWFSDQQATKMHLKCLRALYFRQLRSREDSVKTAHRQTFEWIFDEAGDRNAKDCPTDTRFSDWLRSCDATKNIFWVYGKPGAGKSTLIKFLVRHDRLKEYLLSWVGTRRLIVIEYLFGTAGSYLERSLSGLLRSLLYQILKDCRDLIDQSFAHHSEWMICGNKFDFPKSVMVEALRKVLGLAQEKEVCLLVFIDGLDEFDDRDEYIDTVRDEWELIEILRVFYDSPAIKLCVSSRPWQSFKEEFGGDVGHCLPIHELTRKDIEVYIYDIHGNNSKFR